jgi:apolipoprotein N-acyltransferase
VQGVGTARVDVMAQEVPGWSASGATQVGLALCAGLAMAAGVTWPVLWPLAVLACMAWVWAGWYLSPGRAALWGQVFGTSWLVATVWWLYISLHTYGGLPAALAALAVLLLAAALSLYWAAATALLAFLRTGRWAWNVLLAGALWWLAEWARGVIFTGFPWGASGYALIDAPLSYSAPWVGVYGLGVALVMGAALGLALWQRATGWAQRGWVIAVLVLWFVGPALLPPVNFTQPAGDLRFSLLQTQVPQDQKFSGEHLPRNLERLAQALKAAPGELVVAPETALPLLPGQLQRWAPEWWAAVRSDLATGHRHLLMGLPLGNFQEGYTNSVVGVSPQANSDYRYDKVHLVPFGEFIPTGFRWFVRMMHIPLGDFDRGRLDTPPWVIAGQALAPNICYEDLFGEELAARLLATETPATVLVNLSNLGWFGRSVALPQHLNISRMRTLELQKPMLRATNTGATAHIDHLGRVQGLLPFHEVGRLDGVVEGRQGLTPYARWVGRWGLATPTALAAAVVIAFALRRRRRAARS